MKRLALAIIGVFFLGAAAWGGDNAAQNITSTVSTARYILFSGTYNIDDHGALSEASATQRSAIFKLDTYTGKTWVLKVSVSLQDGNGKAMKVGEGIWVPVKEYEAVVASEPDALERIPAKKNIPR